MNFAGINVNPVLLAVLGMGAFLSGVARTPVTAAVMVFEMTGCYGFILPIMLCCAIADLTAEKLGHKPIYSMLIVNSSTKNGDAKILSENKVKNVMSSEIDSVNIFDTLETAKKLIESSNHTEIPVINRTGSLCGYISKENIEDLMFQGISANIEIQKVMNPNPVTIFQDENLYIAYFRLHFNNAKALFVTDKFNRLKGVITRKDILSALEKSAK